MRSPAERDAGGAGGAVDSAIRAVVFDMDGVLLDSERVYDIAWRQAADMLHLDAIDAVHREALGLGQADTAAVLARHYGAGFDADGFWQLTTRLSLDYEAAHGMPLKPFAAESLGYLAGRGYALAVASSSPRDFVEHELGRAGLLGFFARVVTGDDVTHAKPHPEIYERACAALGVPCGMCAAVEDSPNGIRSAHAAGLRCIMVPDRIMPDPGTLPLVWHQCDDLRGLRAWL